MHSQSVSKAAPDLVTLGKPLYRADLQRGQGTKPISEPILKGAVAACDALSVLGAGLAAAFYNSQPATIDWRMAGLVAIVGAMLTINLLHAVGAYKIDTLSHLEKSFGQILFGWIFTVGAAIGVLHAADQVATGESSWLLLCSTAALGLLSVNRMILFCLLGKWGRTGRLHRNVAVIGAGPIGQRLLAYLNGNAVARVKVVGVYDDRNERLPEHCLGHPIVGGVDELVKDARTGLIDMVIVALPLSADWRLAEVMNKLMTVPVDVRLCPDLFGFQLGACQVSHLGEVPLLNALERPLRSWAGVVKEIEDRVLAAFILFLIGPVLAVIAALTKLDSPGPVFFKQKRYGFNNELIEVWKFRSMYHHVQDQNAEQLTKKNDPRVTRLGAFLRRTSLDELPQFINVLRGEMSIVGPRPHALSAKAGQVLYQEAIKCYDARHRVKPGITGWAQVNGWRGETETIEQIQKRVEFDLYYIEHWSLWFDLKIIVRTILGGFTGRHAY
jgi:Undecaprenyl-phosphate glucose phosphotransferase